MDTKIVSRDALIDDRPQALRDHDYSSEEVASAGAPAEPFQNKQIKKLTATEFNQWYVGSCVPHGFYTQLEYEGLLPKKFNQSQLRAYRKRSNYPGGGSIGANMYDCIRGGQSNDFPTPLRFTEAEANKMPLIVGEKLIKDFTYYQYIDKKTGKLLPENIPADVAIGKAVSIFIYATDDEWSREFVDIITKDYKLTADSEVRHCVCIIPKGDFTKDGKKWLAVHDSAKFGGRHLRYISYEFLLKRTYFAAKVYPKGEVPTPPPTPEPVIGKPVTPCEQGDRGDAVKALQKFMVESGKLEAQYITGYYGALTSKAVLWWQLEHWDQFSVNVPQLLDWGGKYWGQQSINIINK